MGECLRKTCPCLKTLWDRIYGPSPTDGENSVKTDSDCTGDGLGNMESDRYGQPVSAPLPPRKTAASLYTALWDFEARDGQELSFKAGDMLEMVSSSGDWWSAKKIDSQGRAATGFVPFNYLARAESVESQPWFFGKLSRVEALSHLMSAENDNGSFLVRISETDSMGFVLSVKSQAKAKHFRIYHTSGQFYVDASPQFASVLEKMPRVLPPPSVDEWELPKEQFTLEKMLGGGHFADVYSGRHLNCSSNPDALVQKDFQLEVQIMKHFRHRHLISLFAVCTSSAPFYIITELIEKGDLLNFLKNPEGRALDMESLIDMAAQVADGMAYLEAHNSIHRDLAARNVLVGEGYVCKIADFGLARDIKDDVISLTSSDPGKIPYKWTAPEAIGHGRYSGKSDVWSFGILLYEIVTYGAVPYPGVRNCDVYDLITRDNYRMPSPPHCPQVIYNIMRSCWKAEPEDRPTFKILRHELENYQGN
uniref:Tyrosine-protein kinase n=1 Tax=Sinocyclocheilus grahami TaxID=75366 RepID=A0A672MTF8_SINGR